MKLEGCTSYIALPRNTRFETRSGNSWQQSSISRMCARLIAHGGNRAGQIEIHQVSFLMCAYRYSSTGGSKWTLWVP
ncbi:MAG: hypothetical protein KGM95_10085, partial [Betaproteobacteria bacterium]|nr:hypothetical protein [Betaproteobacteria bacterium]